MFGLSPNPIENYGSFAFQVLGCLPTGREREPIFSDTIQYGRLSYELARRTGTAAFYFRDRSQSIFATSEE
jgi:hypothetical protein